MTGSEKEKTLRAAIYIRVSTEDQRKGYSPEFQLEDTLKAATEKDGCVVNPGHIIDDSKSGSTDQRPGWQALLRLARARKIDVVYFWKLDRMMRDEYFFFHNEKELNDLGVQLRFATQNLDDPFVRSIQVAVAAEERRRILERTRRGREAAAKAGKWVFGTPAYGYGLDEETRKLVIIPEEARWVQKFFEWLVYERSSLREIARRANDLRIPTKNQGMKTKRRHAKAWWVRTIGRMLTNELYTGTAYLRKYRGRHKDVRSWVDPSLVKPKEEWIPIAAPAIVSRELFESGLKQLLRNRELAARNAKQTYLFAKLLYCGKCSFRLKGTFANPRSAGSVGSKKYVGILSPRTPYTSRRCRYCGCIAESRLAPIWEALKLTLTDPEYVFSRLREYASKNSARALISERLIEIESELQEVALRKERINFAYLEARALSDREYRRRVSENDARRERLLSERGQAERLRVSEQERLDRQTTLQALYAELRQKLQDASYDTKSEIIHLLVNRIDLHLADDYAQVEFNFPGLNGSQLSSAGSAVALHDYHQGDGSSMPNTSIAGRSPHRWSRNEFTLTVKVPLITHAEWRSVSSAAHVNSGTYREPEVAAMARLAAQKGYALYI